MWYTIFSIDLAGSWESFSLSKESPTVLFCYLSMLSQSSSFFLGILSYQVKLSWECTPEAECFFMPL